MSFRDLSSPAFFPYKLNPEVRRAIEEAINDVKAGRVLKMKRMPKIKELLAIARRQGLLLETDHDKGPED